MICAPHSAIVEMLCHGLIGALPYYKILVCLIIHNDVSSLYDKVDYAKKTEPNYMLFARDTSKT